MKCPNCGGIMEIDSNREFARCPFCGETTANLKQDIDLNISGTVNHIGTVNHVIDRSNDPNLYISYNTIDSRVQMVTRVVTTGIKNTYINNQTLSFHLPQGKHTIVLKIGKKNYNREIIIPSDNSPVKIYASWNGRAQISIDQPNVPESERFTNTLVNNNSNTSSSFSGEGILEKLMNGPGNNTALSIIAFVLSLTIYLSWAGIGLGILDAFVLDKYKEKRHKFSYFAIGIGVLLTIALIIALANPSKTTNLSSPVSTQATIVESADASKAEAKISEIELKYGELGEYGRIFVLNENNAKEASDYIKQYCYFVPAGTYTITNKSGATSQINLINGTKTRITEEGWEEWENVDRAEYIKNNASTAINIKEGQFLKLVEGDDFVLSVLGNDVVKQNLSLLPNRFYQILPSFVTAGTAKNATETEETEPTEETTKPTQNKTTNSNKKSNKKSSKKSKKSGKTVYVSDTGKYHYKKNCSGMKNSTKMSLSAAKSAGYKPCKKCAH